MNIFVGNLSFGAKEADVYKAFAVFGAVGIVAIVMEKKGKKSRGFGFVEMPDEQEALAAIAALHGKALLGRPINVMPALPKKPKKEHINKEKRLPRAKQQGDSRHDPLFKRTGRYKEGKRSLSYLKRRSESGITGPQPERKHKDNPLRWRKKPKFSSPISTSKPWDKAGAQPKPWQRPQTESNPWKKPRAKSSSWKKPEGESKPWQKREGVKPSRFKGRSSSVSHKR